MYFVDALGVSELKNKLILKELDLAYEAGSGVELFVNKILIQ